MAITEKPTSDIGKELWLQLFPWPKAESNKYTRGHAVVVGGPLETCGAAKLVGISALKIAAGLVTILAPDEDAKRNYIASGNVNALMWGTHAELHDYLSDQHVTSIVVGPGLGVGDFQRQLIDIIVDSNKPVLMDADALVKPHVSTHSIITPHEGEFARLFPDLTGSREDRALKAAEMTGSVVVLKGSKTIIASPDRRIFVNATATPWLATAGSGDVLSGMIGGLIASGMPYYEAAIAGVYVHSKAGMMAGPGLIADDLVQQISTVLRELSLDHQHHI